jgi:hypothetical protein
LRIKKERAAKAGLTLSLLTQRQGVYHIFLPKIKGLFDSFFSERVMGIDRICRSKGYIAGDILAMPAGFSTMKSGYPQSLCQNNFS